jgi:hypothetical protein
LRSTRVELEPIRLTEHGQRHRVTYAETLVEGRQHPIFDACRALRARDITGRLEVWRGRTSADMQLDIERGVLFAIQETTTLSLRLVPWHPWVAHVNPNGVLYGGVQPVAAICDSPRVDTRQRKRPPVTPPRNETSTADF